MSASRYLAEVNAARTRAHRASPPRHHPSAVHPPLTLVLDADDAKERPPFSSWNHVPRLPSPAPTRSLPLPPRPFPPPPPPAAGMAAVADELGAALSAAAGPGPPPAAAVAAVTVAVERWVATAVGKLLLAARLSGSPPYPSKQVSLARRHLRPADAAVV